jgi:ABC-type branched-subunit amino acid transport system substrate-binding protein
MQVAVNEALALDQSSYNTQVARVIAAKPDVIFDEFDPQTAGTFFKEYFQQGGPAVPMVSTGAQYTAWISAVKGAMGATNLARVYRNLLFSAASGGPAWEAYKQYLLMPPAQVKNPSQYLYDPFAQSTYDGTVQFALAMLAAKSTNPVTWNKYIMRVANPHPGSVIVHTFASGKRALAAGKSIDFVGCLGQTDYDQWHNSNGYFAVFGYNAATGKQPLLTSFPAADATKLLNG